MTSEGLLPAFEYFIDFEASGLSPDSYPIEVAVVGPRTRYSTLIMPCRYWNHWSYDAQDMHGLTREDLINFGLTPAAVARELNERFSGKILWADSSYDALWMDVLFEAAEAEPSFLVRNYFDLMDESMRMKYLQLMPQVCAHRALPDAMKNRSTLHAAFAR
jgi:hypothetical protein